MSIKYKFLLNKRRKKQNHCYPLRVKLSLGSTVKELGLGITLHESDWDDITSSVKSNNDNFLEYNNRIYQIKSKIDSYNKSSTFIALDQLTERLFPRRAKIECRNDIISFIEQLIKDMKATGKIGNAIVYECTLSKLKAFKKIDKLLFEDVNYEFLYEFNHYMERQEIKTNTRSVYLRTLRSVFNKAINANIISSNNYPFKKFKINSESTPSRSLSIEEMKIITQLKLPIGSAAYKWRCYFLLSFSLIGTNFADILTLKAENLQDERVRFRRKKTQKLYSILVHNYTMNLINEIRTTSGSSYLFDVLNGANNAEQVKMRTQYAIRSCNKYLKLIAKQCDIKKQISTYHARYTWANIAKQLGYSKDMIAEALGHEYGNKVTGIYLDDYDRDIIDQMNLKVIQAIL